MKSTPTFNMTKTEGIKRRLKPVIEKKRRDRINHNLDALRDLLFKNTADTRLQNPKLEKAEILDLAVQYIKKTIRKTETARNSNQMDCKSTQNQFVISPAGPLYTSDYCRRFKTSEQNEVLLNLGVSQNLSGSSKTGNKLVSQKGFLLSPPGQNYHQELLLHPESSLYGSSLLRQSTSPSISSSSQYSSPPSSPTFTSTSCSPSSSPPCPSTSCAAFPDQLSPLITPLSLQRPVFVPQAILPHMTRDLTPPHSPVLALRQDPFPLPNQHAWRPWS
ncbi:hairy-related 11 [Danio rerio]|nr:hairy-related 11 [Danio rerio]AAI62348.1 Hairy-related 11 [Danio rerio]AAI62354.1 Hairy-related 11 [Danio rerio]AAQ82052.1 Her11 [Danio rerio]|eukprot:NP_001003886.1 hairy-related 11 [Danio rerio]